MNGLLSHAQLLTEFKQNDFVLATQRQLIKDFGTAGLDFPETFQSHPQTLNEIIPRITQHLKTLESTNSSALFQLLYQIDLPELAVAQIPVDSNFHTHLAEFILKREAYKVFLRSKFSS